ncbi:MAG: oligosaccharide flippase family protein, partial [Gammaproteobacteria bacterium]|nr:oligosaccharide flippase family protein [Gammaproteobacteria bacterium]
MMMRGAFWIAAALTLSKFAGIISQVVLGAILDPEDFGLFAILLSLGAVVAVVSNGGTQQVLVQEGEEYNRNVPLVFNYALGFNLLAAAALVAASLPMAAHYDNPVLKPMAWILAASIVAGTPGLILKARLSIDLRFKQVGLLMAVSNIGRHASAILLALLGAGVFSLTLPVLVQPILVTLIAWIIVREWPPARHVSRDEYLALFGKTKWLMASTLALALLQHGRYLPVSLFVSTASLGVFFFAAQLITSVVSLFTGAIKEIFFPFFSKLEAGTDLFGQRVRLLLVVLTVIGLTLSVATYLLAEPVIALVWRGRWDAAAICVLWLSLLFPAQLL